MLNPYPAYLIAKALIDELHREYGAQIEDDEYPSHLVTEREWLL